MKILHFKEILQNNNLLKYTTVQIYNQIYIFINLRMNLKIN